ncbi:hypothetical protein FJT64_021477 [Amphibalanus amphitrite]|uniref:Uncharacterized protein n=1 Tax=Amphibalanus amphitrite TaxID=1232801 RepID=A0A6A4WU21_AMPAM|nr:hypothetical protein FJT64_021477 [Amphibalanus amphitrite]
MLYKIGLKFTGAFSLEPGARRAAAVPRVDAAASAASLQTERLVRVVAGSAGRFRPPLAAAEDYISLLDRLRTLLAAGADRPAAAPAAQDHNLTAAVSLMTACFVEHVPGFELEQAAGARAALSVVSRMETVDIEARNVPAQEPSVATRLSGIMVRIWTNWIAMFNSFVRPTTDVQLHQSTNVRVLSLRDSELRAALLSAVGALRPAELTELRRLCAALAGADSRLQPAVGELRHLMDYLADITDLLLTTGAAGRQAIAAGPSAVIRHMGYALLHSLGCFSAALDGGRTADAWGTPSPPTAPPPPPPAELARCQLLEEANSDPAVLGDLEVLMKDLFDMGLTFFSLFKSDPVFSSLSVGRAAATGPASVSVQMRWLMGAVRGSAGRYQFPLLVLEQHMAPLERLGSLLAAGAGGAPLAEARNDHNLTEAVVALTACFVEHVPGYHLEEILEAKSTDTAPEELPPRPPVRQRASDSGSVTLRAADLVANTWRVWQTLFGAFVRPASLVQLLRERNVRVLSVSRPRLRATVLEAVSALDRLQRAELERVCRQLAGAELRFAAGELRQLMAPLAELSRLRLTKAPRARRQGTAGPAGIVEQMGRALPHSLGCFLAALAGEEVDGGPAAPPAVTEIPATAAPGARPVPGPLPVAPAAAEPPQEPLPSPQETDGADGTQDQELGQDQELEQGEEPEHEHGQEPEQELEDEKQQGQENGHEHGHEPEHEGGDGQHPEHDHDHGHGTDDHDPFLTEQDVDVVDDILAGLG